MKGAVRDILILLLIIAAMLAMIVGGMVERHHLDERDCAATGRLFNLSTRYYPDVGGVCQFKVPPGVWVDADEWILIKATEAK
jgi:hypothetical protein